MVAGQVSSQQYSTTIEQLNHSSKNRRIALFATETLLQGFKKKFIYFCNFEPFHSQSKIQNANKTILSQTKQYLNSCH